MTTKATILSTIRQHCLECMGGSPKEVELCTAPNCNLFKFRFGKDPNPNRSKVEQGKKSMANFLQSSKPNVT
jgi:hypothetical protein